MVTGNYDSLTERLCTPVPEGMMHIVVITEIADVTGQYQNIADSYQRILFKPTAVFMKLPYPDEVGKDVIKEIIANTKWNKLEAVSPLA